MNNSVSLIRICFDSIMEQNLLPADLPEVQDLQNAVIGLEREQLSLRQKLNKAVDMNDRTFADLDAARREVTLLKRQLLEAQRTIRNLESELKDADDAIDAKEKELMEADNLIADLMEAADMPTDRIVWG